MSDRNFTTTVEERDFYKERYELLCDSVARLEAQLKNSRAANNLRQRRLDAAVTERDRLRDAARRRAGTVMTRLDFLLRDLCEMDEAECGADSTLHVNADQLRVWLEIWIEEGRLILPDLQPASLSERQREGEAMRGTVPKRDELHRAVLVYSDVRRLRSYRDPAELDALFEAIIDAAEAVLKSDPQGEEGKGR